jgi:hypothetical protein
VRRPPCAGASVSLVRASDGAFAGGLGRVEVHHLDTVEGPDEFDVRGPADHDQAPAGPQGIDIGLDDGVHAGTVHERELSQVEHNLARAQIRLP